MEIKIDLSRFDDHARKLKNLHRSAFPTAVRNTLTYGAKNTKTKTLLETTKNAFVNRSPNFFKANSKYIEARGWNIDHMKAVVGMYNNKLADKEDNYSVENLEQQEHGGTIKAKSFIPMRKARISNSSGKITKKKFRMNDVLDESKVFSTTKSTGKTDKSRYVRTAIYAFNKNGSNAYILGNVWKGNRTLSKIDSISYNIRTRRIEIKRTPLYTYRKNRKVTVAGKNFMKRAAFESSLDLNRVFKREAEKQFKKYLG
jgi:hypothetical protein